MVSILGMKRGAARSTPSGARVELLRRPRRMAVAGLSAAVVILLVAIVVRPTSAAARLALALGGICAIAGPLVSAVFPYMLDSANPYLRDRHDVERVLGVPVLASCVRESER
jgi:hypothetical protein